MFTPAVKTQSFLRLALVGPSGAGKTMWAILLAWHLAAGKAIALIDTEHGSAAKYASIKPFDICMLDDYHPRNYASAIQSAEAGGYGVCIVDSLTHAWNGKGGVLSIVDRANNAAGSGGGAKGFNAWKDASPVHQDLIEALLIPRLHIVATMRSKMAYVQEPDRNGRMVPRKIGLEPIQREGMEYEFDIILTVDADHTVLVTKSRAPGLTDQLFTPGAEGELAQSLLAWLAGSPSLRDLKAELKRYRDQARAAGVELMPLTAAQVNDLDVDELLILIEDMKEQLAGTVS